MFAIRRATSFEEFAIARELFVEYQRAIGVDLCFQSFSEELERLPEMYGHPTGALFLAVRSADGQTVGCVGLRRLEPGVCEMKRLYVKPAARGHGVGRQLVAALLAEARKLQFDRMRLDTLATMTEAQALYESLGFRDIPPYNQHPVEGTRYLELPLASSL
jgi:ribosomal protein S18 acetylase RimI-like enzyme